MEAVKENSQKLLMVQETEPMEQRTKAVAALDHANFCLDALTTRRMEYCEYLHVDRGVLFLRLIVVPAQHRVMSGGKRACCREQPSF